MNDKFVLKFVNNGKPFNMPVWTVAKHEQLLEEMIPYDEQLKLNTITQKDYDKKYREIMILISLREVDPNVKAEDLKTLHPDDFIDLWLSVYNSGKTGIRMVDKNFQKGEPSPE